MIINIISCIRALTILHKHYEDQYLLEEKDRSSSAQAFFDSRLSILSYLISRDSLTNGYFEVPNELEETFCFIQDFHNQLYSETDELEFILRNDKKVA